MRIIDWFAASERIPRWIVLCLLVATLGAIIEAVATPSPRRPVGYLCVLSNNGSQIACHRTTGQMP